MFYAFSFPVFVPSILSIRMPQSSTQAHLAVDENLFFFEDQENLIKLCSKSFNSAIKQK